MLSSLHAGLVIVAGKKVNVAKRGLEGLRCYYTSLPGFRKYIDLVFCKLYGLLV